MIQYIIKLSNRNKKQIVLQIMILYIQGVIRIYYARGKKPEKGPATTDPNFYDYHLT